MKQPDKKAIYQKCLEVVAHRINHAQTALESATEAGNSEDKSSAGDKHETGRAMAQLEQEKAHKQLHEARELQNALMKINPDMTSAKVLPGSLVITDKSNFYVAIAGGKMDIDGTTVFVLSSASPIGKKLLGLSAGDRMDFNGQVYVIKEVY